MSNPDPQLEGRAALSIGEVARLTGRRPSSIRYYEQIGLLPAAARLPGRDDAGTNRSQPGRRQA